jgi:hypothetical protein
MEDQIAVLIDLIGQRERSARLVLDARASDERHRVLATRYLLSLEAFRAVLDEYAAEDAPSERPGVRAVASALGVDLAVPSR